MYWSKAEYLTFWKVQGPDGAGQRQTLNKTFQRQTGAAHMLPATGLRQAQTEARLCNTDQRLSPQVW